MDTINNINDLTTGQMHFLLSAVIVLRVILAIFFGSCIGLIWWVVATNYHNIWAFLIWGAAFGLVDLSFRILNNYLKLKESKK